MSESSSFAPRGHRAAGGARLHGSVWPASVAVLLGAGALLAVALLAGCAEEQPKQDKAMLPLWESLVGHFDDDEQREQDKRAGRKPPPALRIVIVPVTVPSLGEHVFYEEQSTTDYPQRLTEQHLLTFTLVAGKKKDKKIIEAVWSFTDPQRWRGGAESPDLFTSVQSPDIRLQHGCELTWKQDPERKERFTASNDRHLCRISVPGVGSVYSDRRVELTPEELKLSDQGFDAEGALVSGMPGDGYIHFRRNAGG